MKFLQGQAEPLWSNQAPLAKGNNIDDIPTICTYYPTKEKNNHKAIVILPGGGYCQLADYEGADYAKFFSDYGYTTFVVKYRLAPIYHHPAQISDATRAIRVVRENAKLFDINPDKIGIMGSSAGAHLAACCSNICEEGLFEDGEIKNVENSRPNFALLCYPVITANNAFWHEGSFQYLLGENASEENFEKLSMEKRVNEKTPKTFIFHTYQDTCVPVENALLYAMSLKKAKIPFDLHVYEVGEHGIGLGDNHMWTSECLRFLETI